RLGAASGPLMLGYAGLMLLNQLRLSMSWTVVGMGGGGMDGMGSSSMRMGGMAPASEMAMMGADAGMVTIAVIMLASGLIMTVRRGMMATGE
ncbi:MAG: hypothetical protein RI560_07635, partial [Natronomonas sp.]|nr:hypothetical protein [Natronomonas sp.]